MNEEIERLTWQLADEKRMKDLVMTAVLDAIRHVSLPGFDTDQSGQVDWTPEHLALRFQAVADEIERLRDLLVRAADAVKPKAHWSDAGAMWLELFATLDALRREVS